MLKYFFLFFLFFGTTFAYSQSYAYIDSDYILSKVPEYVQAKEKLDKLAERWTKEIEDRYAAIKTKKSNFEREEILLPKEERIKRKEEIENLEPNIPKMYQKFNVVLTHGDFRIDNIIFSKDLDIASLLDWELSTLAPPFIDLSYWCLMLRFESNWLIPGLGMIRDDVLTAGIPEEKDLLQLYKDALGYDIGKSWNFLLAFNCFRFAGILQGVYKRSKDGNNAGKDANSVGLLTEPVSKMGEKLLKLYL